MTSLKASIHYPRSFDGEDLANGLATRQKRKLGGRSLHGFRRRDCDAGAEIGTQRRRALERLKGRGLVRLPEGHRLFPAGEDRLAHVLPEGLGSVREPPGQALVGQQDGGAKLMPRKPGIRAARACKSEGAKHAGEPKHPGWVALVPRLKRPRRANQVAGADRPQVAKSLLDEAIPGKHDRG